MVAEGSEAQYFARLQTRHPPFAAKTRWFELVVSVRRNWKAVLVAGAGNDGEGDEEWCEVVTEVGIVA